MSGMSLIAAPQGGGTVSPVPLPRQTFTLVNRLKTNNVDTGRRIANTLPEGGLNANRKNHGTGFSGDRAFSRPPLGMLHRRTPDGAPRPRPARRADAGTPPDAARSPRPAGFRPSPSRFSPNPRHGRLTWPPNSLRTERPD